MRGYTSFRQNEAATNTNAISLDSASNQTAQVLSGHSGSTSLTAATIARYFIQRLTGATLTPIGSQKFNSRESASVVTNNSDAATGTLAGNPCVVVDAGLRTVTFNRWRPPRPGKAAPQVIDAESIAFVRGGTSGSSSGTLLGWIESMPRSFVRRCPRRPREAGSWHYYSAQRQKNLYGADVVPGRAVYANYVALIAHPRDEIGQGWIQLFGGAAAPPPAAAIAYSYAPN